MTFNFLANSFVGRNIDKMFPGFFGNGKANRDLEKDFGFPKSLNFNDFFEQYSRNGIARAAIDKTVDKTWQTAPYLLEQERDGSEKVSTYETPLEKQIRVHFQKIQLWSKLADADRRSMVGAYAGVILRIADGLPFNAAVNTVRNDITNLVDVIPFWENQLTVDQYDMDTLSPNYGDPLMYNFTESYDYNGSKKNRSIKIHPSRIIIFSAYGLPEGESALKAGYDDLVTIKKIIGAGGEGFWKNAKATPVLQLDKDAKLDMMARAMGVSIEEMAEKMNEQVEAYNYGLDAMLFVQGIEAKTLDVNLPDPMNYFMVALQSFASSRSIPLKILVGSQSGERASTEDANEWSETIMSRRENYTLPILMRLVDRLVEFGILKPSDWFFDWTDLTETSISEKIERASKMADVNQKMKDTGEFVFTSEEIRYAVDYEPLSDDEKFRDEGLDNEEDAALDLGNKTDDLNAN